MDALVKRLKKHEGLVLVPTPGPAGYLNIGHGHKLPITKRQAELILVDDIYDASDKYMAWKGKSKLKLSQTRDEVLVEMIFWHGFGGFLKFCKMIQALKDGDYERAADEMMDSNSGRNYPTRMYELCVLMRDG